jgi:membrane associated rhomboid family serine protease
VFPVGDFLRRRTTPYVNWALIAINIAVFIYTLTLDTRLTGFLGPIPISQADLFYYDWGALPACIAEYFGFNSGVDPRELAIVCPSGDRPAITVFTAMFLHAGWGHIIGNMLFLWIFGDNVEDHLGHFRYLVFYFMAGIAAMATQIAFGPGELLPTVGASGAIAGVLGAYLLLYPKAIVQVVVMPLFFLPFFVPAAVLIGFWFLTQLVFGISEIASTAGTGIAWWAHVGGFVAGALLIVLSGPPRAGPRRVPQV